MSSILPANTVCRLRATADEQQDDGEDDRTASDRGQSDPEHLEGMEQRSSGLETHQAGVTRADERVDILTSAPVDGLVGVERAFPEIAGREPAGACPAILLLDDDDLLRQPGAVMHLHQEHDDEQGQADAEPDPGQDLGDGAECVEGVHLRLRSSGYDSTGGARGVRISWALAEARDLWKGPR